MTVTGQSTVDGRVAPWSARTDTAVWWVGWHLGEIAVVGGSAVLALAWHSLWLALTVPAGVGWIAHERAARRRKRADQAPGVVGDVIDSEGGEVRRGLA